MIDPTSGWALTANGFSVTQNGGRTWRSAEPSGVSPTTILAVQFASADDGWIVSSTDGTNLTIDRTDDAAMSWSSTRLPDAPGEPLIQAVYASLAGSDGWIVVSRGASQSTESATMYVTTNAGDTFRAVPIPTAVPVRFLNPEDRFTVGGAPRAGVYATRNGGTTWRAVSLPQLPNESVAVDMGNTDQSSGESSLLAVTMRHADGSGPDGFAIYSASSAGARFMLNGDVDFASSSAGVAISIPDSTDVIALDHQTTPPGLITYSSTDAGRHFGRAVAPAKVGTASFANATQVASASFVNARLGWALGEYTACFSGGMAGPADCHSNQLLFATTDGGATWSALSPP